MKTVKKIIIGLLLLPTIAIFIGPYSSSMIASFLSPFSLLIIPAAIVNLFILGISIFKHSSWKWPYLIATILTFYLIGTSYNFPVMKKKESLSDKIHLLSWNVDNFQLNMDTMRNSSHFIRFQSPDIICFQELPPNVLLSTDSICSSFDFPYMIQNSREDEVLNLAVFSKWPLINKQEFYFPNSYNKFLCVDVKHPAGTFRLFNIHLQTTGASDFIEGNLVKVFQQNTLYRNKQVELLVQTFTESPFPVVLCGDFNDTPLSYVYRKIETNLLDCFLEAGQGWGGTFQTLADLFRIDYIFCSEHFRVLNYTLFRNSWSDHKIQYVELLIKEKSE